MVTNNISYSVAIRTLGLAGDAYQQELNSLKKQTILPAKIYVYIAEGYSIPKETIGIEQYIYVKKGMVAQRALNFDEIKTDYILLLDDDVELENCAAEKWLNCMIENNADCVAADTFYNQNMQLKGKLYALLSNLVYPRSDDNWAFKVCRNISFSYNNHPQEKAYLSQSAAGPASMWKLNALRAIHYKDELWLNSFSFSFGDDLLFFNKLYRNGYKLIVDYSIKCKNLDAKSSSSNYHQNKNKLLLRSQITFIIWYRICYSLSNNSITEKIKCLFSYSFKLIINFILHICLCIKALSFSPLILFIKGVVAGYRYVHSIEYKSIPNFIIDNYEIETYSHSHR